MIGYLIIYVFDIVNGVLVQGMKIDFYCFDLDCCLIVQIIINYDGCIDSYILFVDQFQSGEYELVFYVGDWLDVQGYQVGKLCFLDIIFLCFGMLEQDYYYVLLLILFYGYLIYCGS